MHNKTALQDKLTGAVKKYYERKRRDRNLRLSSGSGIINHHFGIGKVTLSKITNKLTQNDLTRIINELEVNQTRILLKSMGKVKPQHRVLDAGSGRGGTTFSIINKYGAKVDGITISPYQARFSRDLAKKFWKTKKARFFIMDMLKTTFADNIYDHIVTNETTMYVANLENLFGEFYRILKPGGRYTLATWCINEKFRGRNDIVEKIQKHYDGTKMHTKAEYLNALSKTGFKIVSYKNLAKQAMPYFEMRDKWNQASGIESTYLEGYEIGKIFYLMISSSKKSKFV